MKSKVIEEPSRYKRGDVGIGNKHFVLIMRKSFIGIDCKFGFYNNNHIKEGEICQVCNSKVFRKVKSR